MKLSYDNWKTTNPYEDEQTPADYGWIQKENTPDLEHCKDMIQGIIEAVYKTGSVGDLERFLDELTHQFDMKLDDGAPLLQNRRSEGLMNWYLAYQNDHEQIKESM